MTEESDDEELATRMLCGDEEALREVLRVHLGPVRDVMNGTYGKTVHQILIDEAVSFAVAKMWRTAGSYDKARGTLGAWLFIMAQSRLRDILRREKRDRIRFPLMDPEYDRAVECPSDRSDEPEDKEEAQELQELRYVVENKLKGHQKAIILADLAAGGTANAGSLAEILGTSKDVIYVSRNKAHENIRKEMQLREQRRNSLKGKK
ncbi:MAG: sigma-70 family RNA polymerase sigma factor [Planctomycetes bacterium]|nr:sigma-70 family RNA polymerase sigma factor [Planctomycetota bacterium]